MTGLDLLAVAGLLGVGGVVGAMASAVLAAKRAQLASARFATTLREFVRGSADPGAVVLLESFEGVEAELRGAADALARVKRALRIP